MGKKNKRVPADALLKLLEERHPKGLPVSEAAMILYSNDSLRSRTRVYGLARSLRKVGHLAYALGGVYHLCNGDPDKLLRVGERKETQAMGNVDSFVEVLDEVLDALAANPDVTKRRLLEMLRERAKEKLEEVIEKLA
jgi:hypothetical protein